jgi:hypothetical protein
MCFVLLSLRLVALLIAYFCSEILVDMLIEAHPLTIVEGLTYTCVSYVQASGFPHCNWLRDQVYLTDLRF